MRAFADARGQTTGLIKAKIDIEQLAFLEQFRIKHAVSSVHVFGDVASEPHGPAALELGNNGSFEFFNRNVLAFKKIILI